MNTKTDNPSVNSDDLSAEILHKDDHNPNYIGNIKRRIEDAAILDNPPTDDEIRQHGYEKIAQIRWREQCEAKINTFDRFVVTFLLMAGLWSIYALLFR